MTVPTPLAIQLQRSYVYEVAFSNLLMRLHGYSVLLASEFNKSGAPMLRGFADSLILPDVLAFHFNAHKAAWFDVKLRRRADLYRKGGYLVTGFPLREFEDYERVKALTGFPVWIVFAHEEENSVCTAEIDELGTTLYSHTHAANTMDRGGTIFFRFEQLRYRFTLDYLKGFSDAT
jgi:hypothetical protein